MEFTVVNALGDGLATTPVLREYKRRRPEENVRVYQPSMPALFQNNKYLNRGNHENGRRLHLPTSLAGRISASYAHVINRDLGLDLGTFDDTPELFLTDEERAQGFGVSTDKSVAINAEANWSTRRWSYFAELATMLLARGWSVYHVGADGTPPLPCTRSFHNKLKIRESAALLSRVGRVVCNDTGLMHLAAAVGTPCVTIFGYIRGEDRAYRTTRVVQAPTPCAAECRFTRCEKSDRCSRLDLLSVREVFAEVVR